MVTLKSYKRPEEVGNRSFHKELESEVPRSEFPSSPSQNPEGLGIPRTWDLGVSQSPNLEFSERFFGIQYSCGLSCVCISSLPWNPLPKFVEQKGVPGVRVPEPAPPWSGKQSVQSLGGGTGGVSRKQARGNRQVLMLWGCLQEGWRGREWDGTGHDGEGQRAWAHRTLNVCLRRPQIEESIGG